MAPAPQLASAPMLAVKQFVPLDEASSGTSWQLRKRVTRSTAASTYTSMPPPLTIPAKNKGKGREEEEATLRNEKPKRKRKEGDDGEAHKSRHDLTAKSLVQQAWAQAVRVDGTIVVLHSSNHELACVRHRKTQTLYVSDLIKPPMCKDGKLQVGIYVAAIQDRMDRTKQHLQLTQPKLPYDGGDDLAGGDNDKGDQGSASGGAGRKDPGVDALVAIEKTIQAASKRDMLLLYLRYAPPITVKAAPPLSPRANHTYTLYECLSIVLTSEIGRGATGIVHRGTLILQNGDGSVPLDVVVKVAFDSQQRSMLKTKYETCSRLRSKGVFGGLTTTLGLFDDTEDGPCSLVMLYAGDSLVDKPERVLEISVEKISL
ncbi:hypothetical protein PILCRDRAFT_11962 [Piloderma croceum F 1598]|uniref:Protein kinase domain-containing protein n=1 Tax=Piloderma croceum (strain F 1598) TaxID=765440 RepID=A0A0C3EYC9_PILCF|nr:hypothetical protein PILCRDRAFT_11962 [Piloderma croceum F 1598]